MSSAQMQNLRIGALEEAQWQLASMQLVNFGPFDGYHAFSYKTGFDHAPTTVVAGDSGTGKSTLEDAFFEIMLVLVEDIFWNLEINVVPWDDQTKSAEFVGW